jgi:Haem-binding domain
VSTRFIIKISLGLVTLGLLSLIHPFGTVKAEGTPAPLLEGAETDSMTLQLLERSCVNCHSKQTKWPLYSYVAPTSWLVEHDVQQALSHMNLSQWNSYSEDEQIRLLGRIATEVRSGQMPLPMYQRFHPEARLSEKDADVIYQWARAERNRLKARRLLTDVR